MMVIYQIAADGMLGGGHMTNLLKNKKKTKNKVIALLCGFVNVPELCSSLLLL